MTNQTGCQYGAEEAYERILILVARKRKQLVVQAKAIASERVDEMLFDPRGEGNLSLEHRRNLAQSFRGLAVRDLAGASSKVVSSNVEN